MNEGKISPETSSIIKFFAILHIIICHFNHDYQLDESVQKFLFPGHISVSIFFFFSAYGLTESELRKKHEVGQFIFQRFIRILKPLFFVNLFFFIFFNITQTWDISFNYLLRKTFNNWFVQVILVFYVLFILGFNVANKRLHKVIAISVLTICYIIAAWFIFKLDSTYVNAVFTFPLGIIYSLYRVVIYAYLNNNFAKFSLIIIFCGVSILYFSDHIPFLIIKEIVYTIIANIVIVIILTKIPTLYYYSSVINQYLLLLGAISYEMFLVHPWLIDYCVSTGYKIIWLVPFLVIVMILSYLFQICSKYIKIFNI